MAELRVRLGDAIRALSAACPGLSGVFLTLGDRADALEEKLLDTATWFEQCADKALDTTEPGREYLARVRMMRIQNRQLRERMEAALALDYSKFDGPRDYRDAVKRVLIGKPAEIEDESA